MPLRPLLATIAIGLQRQERMPETVALRTASVLILLIGLGITALAAGRSDRPGLVFLLVVTSFDIALVTLVAAVVVRRTVREFATEHSAELLTLTTSPRWLVAAAAIPPTLGLLLAIAAQLPVLLYCRTLGAVTTTDILLGIGSILNSAAIACGVATLSGLQPDGPKRSSATRSSFRLAAATKRPSTPRRTDRSRWGRDPLMDTQPLTTRDRWLIAGARPTPELLGPSLLGTAVISFLVVVTQAGRVDAAQAGLNEQGLLASSGLLLAGVLSMTLGGVLGAKIAGEAIGLETDTDAWNLLRLTNLGLPNPSQKEDRKAPRKRKTLREQKAAVAQQTINRFTLLGVTSIVASFAISAATSQLPGDGVALFFCCLPCSAVPFAGLYLTALAARSLAESLAVLGIRPAGPLAVVVAYGLPILAALAIDPLSGTRMSPLSLLWVVITVPGVLLLTAPFAWKGQRRLQRLTDEEVVPNGLPAWVDPSARRERSPAGHAAFARNAREGR